LKTGRRGEKLDKNERGGKEGGWNQPGMMSDHGEQSHGKARGGTLKRKPWELLTGRAELRAVVLIMGSPAIMDLFFFSLV
jgi:hypothetical protein